MSAINVAFDLRKLAKAWHDKAQTLHDEYQFDRATCPPYQNGRFSPFLGAFAVFSASADAAAFLEFAAEASENYRRGHQSRRCESLCDLREIALELAEYHRVMDKAAKSLARAMVIEDAIEAGKAAFLNRRRQQTTETIAAEIAAVWYIRDTCNGTNTRAAIARAA